VNPELLKQFNAIKDLEEAVDQTDLELHYQIHLERMAMLDNMLAESNKRIKKLLKGMLK
jgi:hypothetical protein